MATKGYPGDYGRGSVISGLDSTPRQLDGVEIFHAGTKLRMVAAMLANGGRVLNICATGKTVLRSAAAGLCRRWICIDWPDGFCRRDIGWQAVAREKAGK